METAYAMELIVAAFTLTVGLSLGVSLGMDIGKGRTGQPGGSSAEVLFECLKQNFPGLKLFLIQALVRLGKVFTIFSSVLVCIVIILLLIV